MPIPLVILLVCAIGAVIGLINGIIAYLNVTPFITTLGTVIIVTVLMYDFVGNNRSALMITFAI